MEKGKRRIILGKEKILDLNKGDKLYNKYRKKADALGHMGHVRVKRENGMLIFYILVGE